MTVQKREKASACPHVGAGLVAHARKLETKGWEGMGDALWWGTLLQWTPDTQPPGIAHDLSPPPRQDRALRRRRDEKLAAADTFVKPKTMPT